jgi:hypothetical protein
MSLIATPCSFVNPETSFVSMWIELAAVDVQIG